MKIVRTEFRQIALLALFGFLSFSCSDSQFGATGISKKPAEKREDKSSDNSENLGQVDDEDTEADVSVQVSGAYLTCQVDNLLTKGSEDQVGVGCWIFEKDGRRFDLTGFDKKYAIIDSSGNDTGAAFNLTNAVYDAVASLPRNTVDLVSARATISKAGVTEILTSKISPAEENYAIPEAVKPVETLFGSDSDFHIGDGNFSSDANSDCVVKPQKAAAVGEKIIVKMEVISEAAIVSVTLSEMCGVDRSESYVIFSGTSRSKPQKTIVKGSKELVFEKTKLGKGKYSFEVRSGKHWGDHEDFLVGKFSFVAEGEVTFEEPVAGN